MLDDAGDKYGRSALWLAAMRNNLAALQLLCRQPGVDHQLQSVCKMDGSNDVAAAVGRRGDDEIPGAEISSRDRPTIVRR